MLPSHASDLASRGAKLLKVQRQLGRGGGHQECSVGACVREELQRDPDPLAGKEEFRFEEWPSPSIEPALNGHPGY